MSKEYRTISCLAGIIASTLLSGASAATSQGHIEDYQLRTLLQPDEAQLSRESRGSVYIYDGLTDKLVHQAMDEQPERIQSMMFVNTQITDAAGNPALDPETGGILTEDDGCD